MADNIMTKRYQRGNQKKEDRQYNGQKKKHKTEKKIHTFEYVEILILVYVCPKYTMT